MDEDLLDRRPALAADLDRQRPTGQARRDRRVADVRADLRGEAAAGPLEVDLDRLEHVLHERARPGLKLEVRVAQGEVHD